MSSTKEIDDTETDKSQASAKSCEDVAIDRRRQEQVEILLSKQGEMTENYQSWKPTTATVKESGCALGRMEALGSVTEECFIIDLFAGQILIRVDDVMGGFKGVRRRFSKSQIMNKRPELLRLTASLALCLEGK